MAYARKPWRAALAGLLLLLAFPPPASAADRLEEGNALLRKGDFRSASEVFSSLLEREPGNREARIGLARALSFSGNYAGGEKAYREALAEAPGDAEAALGLSDVLAWQKRYSESEEVLARLAADRPADPEVWHRRGKVALWAGDREAARRYFEKALEIDRDNAEARRGLAMLDSLLPGMLRREAETGVTLLRIRRANPGTQAWGAWRDLSRPRWDLFARADYLHRFGEDEGRGTVGAARKWEGGQRLRLEAGASPGADIFSRYAFEAEVGRPLARGLSGTLGGKFSRYAAADVWNFSAALEVYPLPAEALFFRFVHTATRFDDAGSDSGNTWLVKLTHFFSDDDRAWIYYSRGSESYQAVTADQIGNVFADIYGAGGRIFPVPRWGLEGNVDLQRRGDGNRYLAITGIVVRRF